MESYSEIIPNLYIGNYESPKLLFPSVGLIVNCTKNVDSLSTTTIRMPIDDTPDENHNFILLIENIIDIIHSQLLNNQKVLVHCAAGAQRSCAVVVCYLIKYYSYYPERVLEFIRSKRRIAFFGHITFERSIESFYNNLNLINFHV